MPQEEAASETDRTVLVALYEATGGDDWTEDTGWLGPLPIAQWHGVTTNDNGRVTALDLDGNNLDGTIPPEFHTLTALTVLRVGGNQVDGCLPVNLQDQLVFADSDLAGLYFCCESVSPVSGVASAAGVRPPPTLAPGPTHSPASPADKEALVAIFEATDGPTWDASGLWASGRPVRDWPGVTVNGDGRVTGLALQGLGGKLPPELGNLDKLESLSLSGTLNEEIPSSLASLANLSSLSISGSRLCGAIPAELGSLNNLTALDLSNNQLSGAIPPELGSLDKLTALDLSSNRLTGEIPPELGSFAKLTAVDLSSNQLTGEIPTELGNLSRLTYISTGYGIVPVTSLDFSNNRLSGEIPSGLDARWAGLNLSGNPLTGCLSDYLSEELMSRQRRLFLPSLPVCDAASDTRDEEALTAIYQAMGAPGWEKWLSREPISQWQGVSTDRDGRVVSLNLSNGLSVSQEIPPELGNLVNLKYLGFRSNQLSGEIPPELGNLVNLKYLDLRWNQLRGRYRRSGRSWMAWWLTSGAPGCASRRRRQPLPATPICAMNGKRFSPL